LIDFTEDAPIIDSVADEVEFRIDIDEIAPEVHALNEEVSIAEASQQAPSAVPLKTLPEALSVEVDLIAVINLPATEKGERLRNMLMRLVSLDKPVSAYGLSEDQVDFQSAMQSLVRDEEVARLRALMQQLPDEQQFVVRQRIQEEKTFAVIAEELQVPLGTVLTRMRLAIQKLQKWFGREDVG